MKVHLNFNISGVHMLKKNKIIITLFASIFVILLYISCGGGGGAYVEGGTSYFAPYFLDQDNIESDKIKVVEDTWQALSKTEDKLVTRRGLDGVACSLRSSEVEAGSKILAYAKSQDCGEFCIAFMDSKKRAEKYNDAYYIESHEKLYEDKKAGKSPFYLIINDPELDGYDEKYETITLSYNDYDSNKPYYVYLGGNTQE